MFRAKKHAIFVNAFEAPGLERGFADWLKTRVDMAHKNIFVSVPEKAVQIQVGLSEAGFKCERVDKLILKDKKGHQDRYVFRQHVEPEVEQKFAGSLSGLELTTLRTTTRALMAVPREPLPIDHGDNRGGSRVRIEGDHFDFIEALREDNTTLKVVTLGDEIRGFMVIERDNFYIKIKQIGAKPGPQQTDIYRALFQFAMKDRTIWGSPGKDRPTTLSINLYANDPRLLPIAQEFDFVAQTLSEQDGKDVAYRMYYRRWGEEPE